MTKHLPLAAAVIILTLFSTQVSHASERYQQFPLNYSFSLGGFSGEDFFVSASCTVNKNNEDELYSYTISVDYTSDKKRILSWNFLDWILSQYPNAITTQYASAYLFPLHIGEGNYTFRFLSNQSPLLFQDTLMQIFSEAPDVEEQKRNKEVAEKYSGVSVSSYDYTSVDLAQSMSSCLPAHLLVFPK